MPEGRVGEGGRGRGVQELRQEIRMVGDGRAFLRINVWDPKAQLVFEPKRRENQRTIKTYCVPTVRDVARLWPVH